MTFSTDRNFQFDPVSSTNIEQVHEGLLRKDQRKVSHNLYKELKINAKLPMISY